jgi:hypothetical protein
MYEYQKLVTIVESADMAIQVPEILPLHARAKGTSIGISSNWLWNFVVVMITPSMINNVSLMSDTSRWRKLTTWKAQMEDVSGFHV